MYVYRRWFPLAQCAPTVVAARTVRNVRPCVFTLQGKHSYSSCAAIHGKANTKHTFINTVKASPSPSYAARCAAAVRPRSFIPFLLLSQFVLVILPHFTLFAVGNRERKNRNRRCDYRTASCRSRKHTRPSIPRASTRLVCVQVCRHRYERTDRYLNVDVGNSHRRCETATPLQITYAPL